MSAPACKDIPPRRLSLCFWTVYANHYQSAFFSALRARGHDVRVCYFSRVGADRRAMLWSGDAGLPEGEFIVPGWAEALRQIPDLTARTHILPGFNGPVAREALWQAVRQRLAWVHWSEPNLPGLRRWFGLPVRRIYGGLVRRHALGALAIGMHAARDFRRWGIPQRSIAYLPYSTPERQDPLLPDEQTRRFVGADLAFVFCGQLCRRKGVDLLLRAFQALGPDAQRAKLVLVGVDGSGGRIPGLRQRLPCRDRILVRGPVAPGVVDGVMSCCHVCVLPSRHDGWGLALCEGARNRLALIGTDHTGAALHVIEPCLNGVIVRAGALQPLVEALRSYVRDPDLARRHGDESLALHRRIAADTNARRLENALQLWQAHRGVRQIGATVS